MHQYPLYRYKVTFVDNDGGVITIVTVKESVPWKALKKAEDEFSGKGLKFDVITGITVQLLGIARKPTKRN